MEKRLAHWAMGTAAWAVGASIAGMGTMRLRCGWIRALRAAGGLALRACPSLYDGQDNHKRQHASGRVRDRRRSEALYGMLEEAEADTAAVSAREILRRLEIDADRPSQLTEEFARAVFGPEAEGESEVVVQYSGGADSTCAAVLATLIFDRVHLLTFSNPFVASTERSDRNAQKLAAIFPEKQIEHARIDAGEGLDALLFGDYLADLRAYGTTPIAWPCLACKMSFDIETIRYARERGIRVAADGSDLRVEYQLSQGDRTTMALREEFLRDHGLRFVHPAAAIEDTVTELLLFGAQQDRDILLYPQQGCCIGNDMLGTAFMRFYYIPRFGLDDLRCRAVNWMQGKRPVCDGMLNGCQPALEFPSELVDHASVEPLAERARAGEA